MRTKFLFFPPAMGWSVVSTCRQMACGHVSGWMMSIGDNDWPLVAPVRQIGTVGFYSCSLKTAGDYTLESRQAKAGNTNSTVNRFVCNRTGLGDCKNQPWQCPSHGGNSECEQCARRLSGSDKSTQRCRAPTEYFSNARGWRSLSIFGVWSYLAMQPALRCDHKGC